MKRLIVLLCLVALIQPVFSQPNTKDDKTIIPEKKVPKIGYYVFIQKCTDTCNEKFESLDLCYVYIAQFYPDFCADLEYIIERSPYYRENCYHREIYVEKMIINEHGKYKRIKNFKTYLR